jgi:hypothetical protein
MGTIVRWLLATACGASLHAAVAGAPEPGPTGILAVASLTSSNDMFGTGVGNGDDFRTAALSGHLRLGGLMLVADASMLTDRGGGTRSDEAVLAAGWAFGQETPHTGWHAGGFLGGGVRIDSNLHGQEVQNVVHRTIGAQQVHLDQDPVDSTRPVLVGSAVLGWLGQAGQGMSGWWGGQLVAAGQWAEDGQVIAEVGPRVSLVGQEGAFWLGTFVRMREGEAPGTTAEMTGRHEDGWWFDSGTFITPLRHGGTSWGWQVRVAANPETGASLGSLGLLARPGVSAAGASLALEHDLSIYNGGGFGVQLRWYPYPYQDAHRSAVVLDYRFGTEPDGSLSLDTGPADIALGAELRHDQWTVGWEEGYRSPDWSGLRFVPWSQAGAGVRQEGLVVEGPGAHVTKGRATTLVARGAVGLRLEWRDTLSLGASLDGWLPAWSEDMRVGGDSVTLNDPGWAIGLHLAAHIAW